ncbi:MAG TPA: GNAT family N-acetyltransferase [Stellaceae bacterium]|nr:GNAT family N-acetyltransferase [Stellaceae bacterium]
MPPHPQARPELEIARADARDLDGILALMEANQPDQGGTLSALLSHSQLLAMLADLPLMVARRGSRVVAFLLAASKPTVANVPVIAAMLRTYPGSDRAYVYGPVAVDASERGQGLAQRLFTELKRLLPGREGILFIRADNTASLRAHKKMGVTRRGEFIHQGFPIVVFSYFG